MPYGRKQTRSRRTYAKKKRNTYVRRVARSEATKAIKKQIESKIFDGKDTGVKIDYGATTSVWPLTQASSTGTPIIAGTGDDQYIGRMIKPTYLTIRGVFARADATNIIRVCILQDKVSGTALSGANIWESVLNTSAPFSPFERTYNNTFNVLLDRTYNIDTDRSQLTFKIKVSGKLMRKIFFKDGSGNVEAGGLYIAMISDSAISSHPYCNLNWRLTYKDS